VKYLLMMNYAAPEPGYPGMDQWSPEEIGEHIAFMGRLDEDLRGRGELVAAEGLSGPDAVRVVKVRDGATTVTDGPFPETKEFLAGFWLLDVEDDDRALAIAERISAAPGVGGRPMGIAVEVRQVLSAPVPA
jgi:hypothetical protein